MISGNENPAWSVADLIDTDGDDGATSAGSDDTAATTPVVVERPTEAEPTV